MKVSDLLNKDFDSLVTWLEENQDSYIIEGGRVSCPEDIEVLEEEVLCWDGCEFHLDYVDICSDTGDYYMANGTEVEIYFKLPVL